MQFTTDMNINHGGAGSEFLVHLKFGFFFLGGGGAIRNDK
jgi:hypothetical protein